MPKPAPTRLSAPTNQVTDSPAVPENAAGTSPAPVLEEKFAHDRIRVALSAVIESVQTPTSIKGLLAEFYKHIGGRLSFPNFPVTLHAHPRTPFNCDRPFETVWAGLVHHFGATIKAYQQYRVLADQGKETDKHVLAVNNARIQLEEMIDRLETIVKAGVPRLCFAGNLVGGFFLDLA